jgi:hypothetical protein
VNVGMVREEVAGLGVDSDDGPGQFDAERSGDRISDGIEEEQAR